MRNFMPTCTWDIVVDDKPVWHQSVQPHGCFVPLNHYSPPEAGPNSHFARFAYQGKTRNQLCPLCRRRTHHFCGENKTQDLGWLITGLPTRKAIFSNPPCSGAPIPLRCVGAGRIHSFRPSPRCELRKPIATEDRLAPSRGAPIFRDRYWGPGKQHPLPPQKKAYFNLSQKWIGIFTDLVIGVTLHHICYSARK